jgi:O-antigen ligase
VFAGRDRWAVAVLVAGALLTAAVYRPRFGRSHRTLDLGLFACLAFAAAQLIPLPPAVRFSLSPSSAAVDRALLLVAPANPEQGPWHALTLDAESSLWAVGFATAALLAFWSARATFERRRGLRLTIRGIVWFGLALAIVTFVQRALSPKLFYGIWQPIARTNTPAPLGPFLNRNDLATWLILAVPLAIGYVMARASSAGRRSGYTVATLDEILDSRMVVIVASLCLMTGLLLASASRSGIVGCGVGLLVLLALLRRRVPTGQFLALLGGLIVIGAAATAYVNISVLTARFNDVFAADLGRGRIVIWRETWPMARDFWQTGIGVGAFERGMIVYEPRPFELFINQAHDEYLQVLVEGGLPLAAMVLFTIVAGCAEARRRLRDDRTPVAWMRAGALGGMAAVAVQSIWDTGLRMPANAVLFAVLAAIALHSGAPADTSRSKGTRA